MTGFGQSADRAQRLMSLASALQLGRPLTLSALRNRFGLYSPPGHASRRQFERDKSDLRQLGLDIVNVELPDGTAYQIKSADQLTMEWTADEAKTLAILSTAALDPDTSVAVANVTAASGVYPPVEASARIDVGALPSLALTRALVQGRRVGFTYRNTKSEIADRTVEPWGLASRRGLTYLTGFDVDRGEPRVYRIDRILSAVTDLGSASHDRPDQGLGTDLTPQDRTTVEMHVAPSRVPDAQALGAEVAADGGRVRVTFHGIREETAVGWALRHRARVLNPEDLSSETEDRRARLRQLHDRPPPLEGLEPTRTTSRPRTVGLSDQRLARLLALPAWMEARPWVTLSEAATAFSCDPADIIAELDLLDRVELPGVGPVFERDIDADGQVHLVSILRARTARLTPVLVIRLLTLVEVAICVVPDAGETLRAIRDNLDSVLPETARGMRLVELDRDVVQTARTAIETGRALDLGYRGRHDEHATDRYVAPLQLQLVDGNAYVAAVDLDAGESRTFRLDRITHAHLGEKHPPPTGPVPLPKYRPEREVEIELLLGPGGTWILGTVSTAATAEGEAGAIHAAIRTDAPDWLLAHVRAAGGDAQVLRPPDLRQRMLASVDVDLEGRDA